MIENELELQLVEVEKEQTQAEKLQALLARMDLLLDRIKARKAKKVANG